MIHRHISIFVSSTFRDMQAERDYLKKHVLPKLQEELLQYGITVSMTDLRWGIDTSGEDETAREEKVLHVCLDAISRDRPYFIGLLGGRYGWIPAEDRVGRLVEALPAEDRELLSDVREKSVTEIEILFGALANSDVFRHSFFFFRNSDVYASIPEEYRKSTLSDRRVDFIYMTKPLLDKVVSAENITDGFATSSRDPRKLSNFCNPSDHYPIVFTMKK